MKDRDFMNVSNLAMVRAAIGILQNVYRASSVEEINEHNKALAWLHAREDRLKRLIGEIDA